MLHPVLSPPAAPLLGPTNAGPEGSAKGHVSLWHDHMRIAALCNFLNVVNSSWFLKKWLQHMLIVLTLCTYPGLSLAKSKLFKVRIVTKGWRKIPAKSEKPNGTFLASLPLVSRRGSNKLENLCSLSSHHDSRNHKNSVSLFISVGLKKREFSFRAQYNYIIVGIFLILQSSPPPFINHQEQN